MTTRCYSKTLNNNINPFLNLNVIQVSSDLARKSKQLFGCKRLHQNVVLLDIGRNLSELTRI